MKSQVSGKGEREKVSLVNEKFDVYGDVNSASGRSQRGNLNDRKESNISRQTEISFFLSFRNHLTNCQVLTSFSATCLLFPATTLFSLPLFLRTLRIKLRIERERKKVRW